MVVRGESPTVEEAVEEVLRRGHHHLRLSQEDASFLDELTSKDAVPQFDVRFYAQTTAGGFTALGDVCMRMTTKTQEGRDMYVYVLTGGFPWVAEPSHATPLRLHLSSVTTRVVVAPFSVKATMQ